MREPPSVNRILVLNRKMPRVGTAGVRPGPHLRSDLQLTSAILKPETLPRGPRSGVAGPVWTLTGSRPAAHHRSKRWPPRHGYAASGAWSYQPNLVGSHSGLGAVAQSQLFENVNDVGFHGRLGDVQIAGYLSVRSPSGHEP
jgi:hypothetical protein